LLFNLFHIKISDQSIKGIIMIIINNFNSYIPREISTAAFGITLAAAGGVALQIISAYSKSLTSNVMRNFIVSSCSSATIVGTVMTIYSTIRLCQKIGAERSTLSRSITVTALGVLSSAFIAAIGEHCWTIAPCFSSLNGHSMAYAIATNFVWQAAAIAGICSFIFTPYASYRLGVAAINQTSN
jgi:hypothetical protein